MENNPTGAQDKPLKQITIADCGELLGEDKLNKTNAVFLPNYIDIPMNLTDMHTREHEDDTGSDGDDTLVDQRGD